MSATTSLRFDIVTIFPEFFRGPLDFGMVRQALKKNLVSVAIHNLRDHAGDRHRTVDDRPFGGGEGMVLKPEPLFRAISSIASQDSSFPACRTILLSAQGRRLTQETSPGTGGLQAPHPDLRPLRRRGRTGHRLHLATDEVSIGDYVLSGGELAACVLVDCIVRMVPGVLHNHRSTLNESFSRPAAATQPGKQHPGTRNPGPSSIHPAGKLPGP